MLGMRPCGVDELHEHVHPALVIPLVTTLEGVDRLHGQARVNGGSMVITACGSAASNVITA